MGKFKITDFFVYRWRYVIGYCLVAIGLIIALVFVGKYLPGGISNQEIQSVITSTSINVTDFWSIDAINLPYHLAQHISVAVFGVSTLSIKLPSIILAFLSALGLVLLFRQWFKPRISILASLIALTTGQFLFIAQNGTPDVLYLFWPVWIILLASLIPTHQRFRKIYKIAFFTLAAFSLYTPLSIYVLFVIFGTIVLHPHLRFLIRQLSFLKLAAGIIIFLLIVTPLILTIIKTPDLGLTLLGLPTKWPDFSANLASLGAQYLGFTNNSNVAIVTPFFGLGSVLLIAIGTYFVIKTKATSKSYLAMLWTLCLIPIIILNPNYTSITFLPLVLLLASGLNGLLTHWYKLFPRNPYARISGLIPLMILVIILVSSGVNRYIYGYLYDPNIAPKFSKDLQLIPDGTKNIVVDNSELAFYKMIAEYNAPMKISIEPNSDTFLATHAANRSFNGYVVDKIITSSTYNNGDRFYLYKK